MPYLVRPGPRTGKIGKLNMVGLFCFIIANVGLLLDSKTLGPFAVARCIVILYYLRYYIVVLYMQQNKSSDS